MENEMTFPLLPESVNNLRPRGRIEPVSRLELLQEARRERIPLTPAAVAKRDRLLDTVETQFRRVQAGLPVDRARVDNLMSGLERDDLSPDEAIPFSQIKGEIV